MSLASRSADYRTEACCGLLLMVGLIAKLVRMVIKRLLAGVFEREPSVPQCRTVSTESNALLQLPIRIVGRVAMRLALYTPTASLA
jgi:hypothetical protein